MISASIKRRTGRIESTVVLEIDIDGAQYIADIMRQFQPNDHGARDIADSLEAEIEKHAEYMSGAWIDDDYTRDDARDDHAINQWEIANDPRDEA